MALLVTLSGCGGTSGTGPSTATISGIVTDIDGNPVRGANVHSRDSSTVTSVSGAYILQGNREDDLVVVAELSQNGENYSGRNLARTFSEESSQSVNIVVSKESEQAVLVGHVEDGDGQSLEGVNVFAFGGGLSSSRGITDRHGNYRIEGLVPGFSYTLNAGGRNYSSDETSVVLEPRETRSVDFVLFSSIGEALPPPQNLAIVSWIAPVANRSSDRAAYEAIKSLIDPRRRTQSTRLTNMGSPVEIEIFFDPVLSLELLGYGVYRAQGDGPFASVTFLREPIAGYYADLDTVLAPFTEYTYALTSLNTEFPNGQDSESDLSESVTVQTLGDLLLSPLSFSPLTFRWNLGSGAEEYEVYLFENYPGIGQLSMWNSSNSPTTGASQIYDGPPLVPGRRYYYIVLGTAFAGSSRTLSQIGTFLAP